ncbi:cell division cycle regulator protein, putative [Ixodes scapularis]|uniref:Cell division cycle protein 27 homolog n=1 Tax=Ixodes scapularis TaxID=6945 RepID=B7QD41_IXOSC|nr:cell division cycle regulator protein, putative [Ixodes scapularis]|eukprot:XP_002413455.1 cell division cycle regulator protein, putative [Ixodes scapularis]
MATRVALEGLMELLQDLGRAQLYLGQYRVKQAIETLQDLPPHQYSTGWVLAALGRAYFELGEYDKAVRVFEELRTLEPYRLKGLEYYSTSLWHLQREVHLSTLAQELMDLDKNAATTCAVAGNCFSLQREHETAVKFLQRAVQVQHALKKTEMSLTTLNSAMTMEPRNPLCKFHRASIFFSLDRYQEALKELDELKQMVPKESLVYFLCGKVHKKLGNTHLALMNFSWAMDLDPKGANNQIKESIDKRGSPEDEDNDASLLSPSAATPHNLRAELV